MKPVSGILTESVIDHSFSVKRLENDLPYSGSFVRLNYHHILMVESGRGVLVVDEQSFDIAGHKIFLLSKGQICKFENHSDVSGYHLSFGDCFWERVPSSASNCKAVLFNNAAANQQLLPDQAERDEFLILFKILLAEYETKSYTNQMDVLAAYLKIIMVKLANIKIVKEETFDSQDYIVYRKFMELLSSQYHSLHAVNDYSGMLNITPRRLSGLCKRCSNKSAKEIINGQIIAEAKRLLQFSSYTVKEIAYQLHFGTSEQFSHFFKKNTEISPASYRSNFIHIGM
ncbi:helix-turn-helix domain-containing protein [Chryseobacterium panacisoli]|uniref:Helix-turn-helix domain-containing protein n=1 Tax=Chryseobacterium panacisoli TaxID=1807141 RepID=A0A5D8ZF72_9FLAO|nr:helix-turn-helix domain-containing protein [Chryseobacterium panacisoli]TZF93549.1 helix-turn-helix domain-containing protein [Chryseobacterium panacisoli]